MRQDYCTWFPEKIFGVYIGDLCYDHDAAYSSLDLSIKFKSDYALAKGVWRRSSRSSFLVAMKATAITIFIATSTVGTLFWIKGYLYDKCN